MENKIGGNKMEQERELAYDKLLRERKEISAQIKALRVRLAEIEKQTRKEFPECAIDIHI
jgi:hypothetical protein